MASSLFSYEDSLTQQGYLSISGIDEAGIGPLAGPVVAAAVVLDLNKVRNLSVVWSSHPSARPVTINDSKQLTPEKREALYPEIIKCCIQYNIQFVFPPELNQMRNIQQSGYLARFRAVSQLHTDYILSDHFDVPESSVPSLGITKGDSKSVSIAAASILAKVSRDRYMIDLAKQFPQYGFEKHKGYDIPQHREAIRQHGVTVHHKLWYGPIVEILAAHNNTI
jgi:ribonuclease HII